CFPHIKKPTHRRVSHVEDREPANRICRRRPGVGRLRFGVVGIEDAVGESEFHRLAGAHPGFLIHQASQLIPRKSRLDFVRVDDGLLDLIQDARRLAQEASVASRMHPWIVDHHHCRRGHQHFVARHGDNGCSRESLPVDLYGDLAFVLHQSVVDAGRRPHHAANAIDPDGEVLALVLRQLLTKGIWRYMWNAQPLIRPRIVLIDDLALYPQFCFRVGSVEELPKALAPHSSPPPWAALSSTTSVSSRRMGRSPPSIGGRLRMRRHSLGVSAPRSTICTSPNFVCILANVSAVASNTIRLPKPRSRRLNSLRVNSSLICWASGAISAS